MAFPMFLEVCLVASRKGEVLSCGGKENPSGPLTPEYLSWHNYDIQ
jgi:hypothetical protein